MKLCHRRPLSQMTLDDTTLSPPALLRSRVVPPSHGSTKTRKYPLAVEQVLGAA